MLLSFITALTIKEYINSEYYDKNMNIKMERKIALNW